MKKATAILPLASLILLTGCDVSWQQVTAAIAVATREPAFAILALSDNNTQRQQRSRKLVGQQRRALRLGVVAIQLNHRARFRNAPEPQALACAVFPLPTVARSRSVIE